MWAGWCTFVPICPVELSIKRTVVLVSVVPTAPEGITVVVEHSAVRVPKHVQPIADLSVEKWNISENLQKFSAFESDTTALQFGQDLAEQGGSNV